MGETASSGADGVRRIHGLWLRRDRQRLVWSSSLVLGCWLCSPAAHAAPRTATPATTAKDDAGAKPPHLEMGLQAFYGDSDDIYVGALGFTFEGLFMPSPHYGFGGSFSKVHIDNGSDAHYASSGTLQDGHRFLAFVEGDLFDFPITPYARLGIGGGPTSRWDGRGEQRGRVDVMAEASAGAVARLGPVSLRVFASPSLFGADFVMIYGIGLGVVFAVKPQQPSSGTIEP
jgi:hypothetical protein